jgi:alpha-tubulin suppressor-like RCC1 family protein
MYSLNNHLYSWGLNVNGQLGILSNENQHLPQLVIKSPKILSISCGGQFTGFITENKEVFLFGSNKKNQLGFNLKDFKSMYFD